MSFYNSIQLLNPPNLSVDLKSASFICADVTVSTHELFCALFEEQRYIDIYRLRLAPEGAISDIPIQISKIGTVKVPVDFMISRVKLTDSLIVVHATRTREWQDVNKILFWYRFPVKGTNLFPLGSLDLSDRNRTEHIDFLEFEFLHNSVLVGNTKLRDNLLRIYDLYEPHMTVKTLKKEQLAKCALSFKSVTADHTDSEVIPFDKLLMSEEEAILKIQIGKSVQQIEMRVFSMWMVPLLVCWLFSWKKDQIPVTFESLEPYIPEVESSSILLLTGKNPEAALIQSKLIDHSIIDNSVVVT